MVNLGFDTYMVTWGLGLSDGRELVYSVGTLGGRRINGRCPLDLVEEPASLLVTLLSTSLHLRLRKHCCPLCVYGGSSQGFTA